jgi:cleavage and polyadenylation specificity factor subunit 1
MVAMLQQHAKNAWQPLAFFSKKLNPAQQKYSAYDRELPAIYEAVKHFRHMLEAQNFTIFTAHKSIAYAFQQKRDKCSPRAAVQPFRLCHPVHDRHQVHFWSGQRCRRRSRVQSVTAPSYDALAASQDGDDELRTILGQSPPYGSRNYQSPTSRSQSTAKRLLGYLDRTFQVPYGSKCSSPSTICRTKATEKLVAQRFVWPVVQKDCRTWTRTCQSC